MLDPEIARFYRSLIPKSIRWSVPMYAPHISVVRKETPVHLEHWGKYENHDIEIEYESTIRFGTLYVWLNCFSTQLEDIRRELGLPVHSPYTLPPEGFNHCFHSTIANFKT